MIYGQNIKKLIDFFNNDAILINIFIWIIEIFVMFEV